MALCHARARTLCDWKKQAQFVCNVSFLQFFGFADEFASKINLCLVFLKALNPSLDHGYCYYIFGFHVILAVWVLCNVGRPRLFCLQSSMYLLSLWFNFLSFFLDTSNLAVILHTCVTPCCFFATQPSRVVFVLPFLVS